MEITLDASDISALSASTRAELQALFFKRPASVDPKNAEDLEWDDVVDFSLADISKFMDRVSDKTKAGLQIIAEHGPRIGANLLNVAGINNYGQFQSAVTRRTRTISGDESAFLFTWDDWEKPTNIERGYGDYAVSATTFKALREYFGIS